MQPFATTWHWKDWTIIVLAAALLTVGGLWLQEELGSGVGEAAVTEGAAEAVSVFDVVLDREGRAYVDVFFDRPVAHDRGGEILGLPPATIEPPLAGVWRWRDEQILRFEPSGGFPVASRWEVALIPERFLEPDQVLAGEPTFELETDRFLLEQVAFEEVPSPLGGGRVTLHGRLQFNYAVDPRQLAPLVHLVDPLVGPDEPVEVELEDVYWSRQVIDFRTGEVQKEKAERTLELIVDGALTPSVGNAPLGEDAVHQIPLGSRDRLAVREVVSTPGLGESTLRLELSSPVDPRVAGQYLRIEPETELRASVQRNTLTLTGAFRPGGRYTLALAAGLPAEDGATLPEAYETTLTLSDLPPSLEFQSQGTFLAASGFQNVAVESVNVDRFELAIDRAYANNLFFLFDYQDLLGSDSTYSGSSLQHTFGDRIVQETVRVKAARNTRGTTVLPIGRYVSGEQPGLYRVLVTRPGQWQAAQRWLLLTDLGAVVKQADGEVLAWVSSVDSLAPVGGARVTLISDQNQTIAQGRTDADGFWRFRDAAKLDEHRPYLVKVEKGEDFTFVALDRMGIDTTGLEVGGAPATAEGYSAFLYGERDLYRPGETAEGLAIVRDGALRPSPAMPALLRHRDPRGLEVETRTVTVDARGLAPFELDLPPYALTGNHTLELEVGERVIGSYRFQVEEFIPDRIKVEIAPGGEAPGPGEELQFDVASSYLFGPPAASLPVEARVRLVPAELRPPGFEGFSFRNDERQLDAREILTTEGTLDETGHQSFVASIPAGLEPPSSLQAVITARVSEQGGRGVAARTAVPVHPYPYYLGLRRSGEGSAEPGQEVELEYVAVTPDGKATASGELRAELYFVRWNTVLRRTPSGSYKYETVREPVLVADQTLSAGNARGSFRFTPADYGSHRVVITDPSSGASASVDFWASGWGYSPWAMENPSRIELELDRPGDAEGGPTDYAPGETATLQVRAPFPGRLLVTVEREEIFYTRVYDLPDNTATVEIPIRGEYRPNVYVTATLVRSVSDLEPGGVGRAFGAVPLPVDRTANRLAVRIEAPAEVRSESTLEVEARAKPGSVVTIAAVDEGILQLIAQKTPDPFELFYRKLALGVRSFDTFSLLLPEVALEGAAEAGGGLAAEGAAQYVRTEGIRRVEPVAFWSGPVEVGSDGRATVRFELPEFQGALRLMAVAVRNEEVGSSDRQTRVRDPLVLLPTLPRILSFDETLRVPVTVRNDSGRSGAVQVTLAVDGPAKIEGDATLSIPLENGTEGTVYFAVRTGSISGQDAGEVRFAFRAEGLGERGKASGRVGVRADLPVQAFEQAGSLTEASFELPLSTPTELRPETVRRELRVGTLPLVQFAGKLDALVRYPYGCLEQTVSQAFPQIYLADLIGTIDPELLDPDGRGLDPEANVAEALRRVAGLQLASGGFSLWPGWNESHPWTSVYAGHFLVEAERAGYPVASHTRDRALAFLGTQVRAKSSYGATELARTVYALYVLARAGQADLGTMDFLEAKHLTAMRPESKALLAAAYAAVGRQDTVDELVAHLQEVEQVERQTGEIFDSTVRNRALLLMALLDAAPQSPRIPALAERLARDAATDPWWTTQETGFTLLALGQLVHRQVERPPYRGKVYLGERLLGAVSSDEPARFPGLRGDGPLRIVMEPGYEAGAAFFSVITRGIPTDEGFQPSAAGLEIERTYLTREGDTAELGQVRQGDLLVIRTRVRSVAGDLQNVVIQNLLPSGLEVENPRLETTETLPWATPSTLSRSHLDLRDDRILLFTDLPTNRWQTVYALVRAVSPGEFRVPPAQAEAMYNPALHATGPRGRMRVTTGEDK